MIYFGHSFYDIQGKKYLKNNFETLEVQNFTNTFWNFKRENFSEQMYVCLSVCVRLSVCLYVMCRYVLM